ncbi:MAG: hypothetical protein AAF772_02460 [Acidobacteriota bacterium]
MLTPARAVLWTLAIAAIVRLVVIALRAPSPFLTVPVLDGAYYDAVARVLLADPSQLAALDGGFRPLLYPALVALAYAVAGDPALGMALALIAQHALGALTAGVVAALAMRLDDGRPASGLAAGLLYAFAGPAVFFEGELLITTLFVFLTALVTWRLAALGGADAMP